MNAIECKNVTKRYGKKEALSSITCSIEENKIAGLIGRNGAGKSTFLKTLAGFSCPSSGECFVFEHKPFNSLFVSVNSIFVDEQMRFPDSMTVGEILTEGKRFYPNWQDTLSSRLLDYFEIKEHSLYRQLSKGQAALFRLTFGLSARCPLTLFDEPMSGMDLAVRKDMYRALLKDYLDCPRTILISSHQLDEMDDLLEDILLFDEGALILHVPMEELQNYAVRVHSASSNFIEWLNEQHVFEQKTIGSVTQAVIKRDGSIPDSFSPVALPASEASLYITNKNKGGIDRVFN